VADRIGRAIEGSLGDASVAGPPAALVVLGASALWLVAALALRAWLPGALAAVGAVELAIGTHRLVHAGWHAREWQLSHPRAALVLSGPRWVSAEVQMLVGGALIALAALIL
jgi:hypothetical protein